MITKMIDLIDLNYNKELGNHRLEIKSNGNKHLIYFSTCICKIDDSMRIFATDRSYGTRSTSKACTKYERALLDRGYNQVSWGDIA